MSRKKKLPDATVISERSGRTKKVPHLRCIQADAFECGTPDCNALHIIFFDDEAPNVMLSLHEDMLFELMRDIARRIVEPELLAVIEGIAAAAAGDTIGETEGTA